MRLLPKGNITLLTCFSKENLNGDGQQNEQSLLTSKHIKTTTDMPLENQVIFVTGTKTYLFASLTITIVIMQFWISCIISIYW